MTEPVAPLSGDMALPRVGKRGAPQAFARKLYEILSTESTSVISWNSSGTAFHVRDVDTFSEETLTKYYRHSKFSSFQRQLNLYSFRKIVKGPDAGGYAHPMFHRDRPDDLYHVRRSISGSARYEPAAARVHASGVSVASASLTVRKGGGRASSKGTNGEWTLPRAHKSRTATRRVGKFSGASVPKRRDSSKERTGTVVSTSSITAEASVGDRSLWTSGEESDSGDDVIDDVIDESGQESDSDSDSEGEVDGAAEKNGTAAATDAGVADRAQGSQGLDGRADAIDDVALFSCVETTNERPQKGMISTTARSRGVDGADGVGGTVQEAQESRECNAEQPAARFPTRTSPFNFFRKKFSFREKSHHNRVPSASSVDMTPGEVSGPQPAGNTVETVGVGGSSLEGQHTGGLTGGSEGSVTGGKDAAVDAAAVMPPPPKREQREELGLVEQLTNMVEVFDICDLLRRVSTSSRQDKPGPFSGSKPSQHTRQMSLDTDSGLPTSPQTGDRSGLPSLASMELTRDSSRDWDTLMAGSADVSDLGNSMVQSVAEFFSF